MRNDLQLKITSINKDGKYEIHLDYYNKDNELIGTILVKENGVLDWSILNRDPKGKISSINKGVEDNILYMVSYIMNQDIEDTLESHILALIPERDRWKRIYDYIEKSGIYVNYKNNQYYNTKRYENLIKRRR